MFRSGPYGPLFCVFTLFASHPPSHWFTFDSGYFPCIPWINAKIQIIFPNPLMGRVRAVAAEKDRPVSEVIRRAVERFLEMRPEKSRPHREIPTFRGGQILMSAVRLKDVIYDNEHL
jgi:hypothetical protein